MHDRQPMNSIGLGEGKCPPPCNVTLDVYFLQRLDGFLSFQPPCMVVRILIVLTGAFSSAWDLGNLVIKLVQVY